MRGKIRVGVIGCGGIAQGHIQRLVAMPEVEVAGLMDPDPTRLENTVRNTPQVKDVPHFSTHRALIKKADLDAVVICSPHFAHYQQIVDSLRAGLHVLTEKPMVCSIRHAKSVMKEEKKAKKVLAISYQRHCMGQFQFIRNALASGEPGTVKFISALQGQAWLQGTKGKWRQSLKLSCGGQLNDSGSHLIDIILWMTGLTVKEVSAHIDNCGTEVDINSTVSFRCTNGALGSLSVIGSCPTWWEDITIVCEKWAFFLRQGQLTYTTGTKGEMHKVESFNYGSPSPTHNFIDAIMGRAQVLAPSICGLRTIELTEAAWKSGATGKPVRL
jgi:predicted dehydrogenase